MKKCRRNYCVPKILMYKMLRVAVVYSLLRQRKTQKTGNRSIIGNLPPYVYIFQPLFHILSRVIIHFLQCKFFGNLYEKFSFLRPNGGFKPPIPLGYASDIKRCSFHL